MKIHISFQFRKIKSKTIDQFLNQKKSDRKIQIRSETIDQFLVQKIRSKKFRSVFFDFLKKSLIDISRF